MDPKKSAVEKLSFELWGIEWDRYLPHRLDPDGKRVICNGDASECLEFASQHAKDLYDRDVQDSPFESRLSAARQKYYDRVGDFLAFRDAGQLVGFLVGTPIDWDSYYLRYSCVLPEAREIGWLQSALLLVLRVMSEHGVAMAEADAAPSNLITTHVVNKLGFYATGSTCTTRWGTLIRYVNFLDPKAREFFLNQFCFGIRPDAFVKKPKPEREMQ